LDQSAVVRYTFPTGLLIHLNHLLYLSQLEATRIPVQLALRLRLRVQPMQTQSSPALVIALMMYIHHIGLSSQTLRDAARRHSIVYPVLHIANDRYHHAEAASGTDKLSRAHE
jgi:hypothetical protein